MLSKNNRFQYHSTTKQLSLKLGEGAGPSTNWSGGIFTQSCEQANRFLKITYKPQVIVNKPKTKTNFLKFPKDFQNNHKDTLFP